MADATIDVESLCRNSGSARSKTYCGSGHRLKQWHERDTLDDSIFIWPAIISRESELFYIVDCAGYDFLFADFCQLFFFFSTDFRSYRLPCGPV